MRTYRHAGSALRIDAGPDCLRDLEGDLARQGVARAVVFTGRTLGASPLLDLVRESAGPRCAGVYAGVKVHTPRSAVVEAARALGQLDADAIIVFGGGSAVVSARAAAIFHAEGDDLDAICTRRVDARTMHSPRLLKPKLPLIVLPTTPNTACVKAGAGVFDEAAGERKAIFDPQTRARSIFLHPDLLMSAPPGLVVSAGLDTLLLAIEGLLSPQGDAISDALLIHALRLLAEGLLGIVRGEDGPRLREELTMAGILAGRGSDHAPAGATTALGHAIGANHHVENGVAKAAILPHVLRFNAGHGDGGFAKLATGLGLEDGADIVERINARLGAIFGELGLPPTLRELGIPEAALADIAGRAMNDWFILGNARPVRNALELQEVLVAAY